MLQCQKPVSLSIKIEKERPVVQPATNDRVESERRRSPVLRPIVQHVDIRQGEKRKMANCVHFIKTNYKVKSVISEIRSEDQTFYLDRYSPRGSRHLVEPT